MNSGTLIIWVASLAWVLYRQLQRRPIGRGAKDGGTQGGSAGTGSAGSAGSSSGGSQRWLIGVIFMLVGLIELVSYLGPRSMPAGAVGALVASFAIGLALSVVRAFTVRLWFQDARLWRQGTWITVLLWLVAVGIHLADETLIVHEGGPRDAGQASMLLYLGGSLLVQTLVLRRRAQAMVAVARMARQRDRAEAGAAAVSGPADQPTGSASGD